MKNIYTFLCVLLILMGCAKKSSGTDQKKNGDDKKRRWKMVTSYPRALTTFTEVAEYFTKNIAVFTGKKLNVKSYQPGELVPALSVFDAVSKGSVEMGVTTGYFYSGKNPAFILDTGEPFGMIARQKNAWLYEGGGLELLQALYRKYNIMYLPFGNTGAQMGGWFKKEIKSLEDIKGLRLRVPGIAGMIYSKLGASVQVLGAGDIYLALEQGTLDGAEFVGPYDDQKLGFQNTANYYYTPGWQECAGTIALYINLEKWNELPSITQKMIISLSKICNQMMIEKYDAYNSKALLKLKSKGVIIKKFSDEILTTASKINQEILAKYIQENADFKKIYESITAFKKQTNDWFYENEYLLQKFKYERRP